MNTETSVDQGTLEVHEGFACYLTKAAPHVLQAFNATVACILLELYLKIAASVKMKRFDGDVAWVKVINMISIVVVPLTCMIVM